MYWLIETWTLEGALRCPPREHAAMHRTLVSFLPAGVLFVGAACNSGLPLTSSEVFRLTNGQAFGSVSLSPDARTLAFSDGQNIFTLDLTTPNAAPVQVTSATNAFAPSFLSNGQLVFGTI